MNLPRPILNWHIGSRRCELGVRTRVMGIVNLTPDSFYAPSRIPPDVAARRAVDTAGEMLADGADILDLGAESTRPGATPVSTDEEQTRLLPALKAIRRQFPHALLSVDTRHAATARAALEAGADILNDVSGGGDAALLRLVADSGCGVVLMHSRGEFATMQHLPPLTDPVAVVREGLATIRARAVAAGVAADQIVLDPGFGFGKNLDQNFPVLAHLDGLRAFGSPLLVGLSRKSFLRHTPDDGPERRLAASLAGATAAVLSGAHCIRAHDVAATIEAVRIADRLLACL